MARDFYIPGRTEIFATNRPQKLVPDGMAGRLLLFAEKTNAADVRVGGEPNKYPIEADGQLKTNGPVSSGDVEGFPLAAGRRFPICLEASKVYIAGTDGDVLTWIITD